MDKRSAINTIEGYIMEMHSSSPIAVALRVAIDALENKGMLPCQEVFVRSYEPYTPSWDEILSERPSYPRYKGKCPIYNIFAAGFLPCEGFENDLRNFIVRVCDAHCPHLNKKGCDNE